MNGIFKRDSLHSLQPPWPEFVPPLVKQINLEITTRQINLNWESYSILLASLIYLLCPVAIIRPRQCHTTVQKYLRLIFAWREPETFLLSNRFTSTKSTRGNEAAFKPTRYHADFVLQIKPIAVSQLSTSPACVQRQLHQVWLSLCSASGFGQITRNMVMSPGPVIINSASQR